MPSSLKSLENLNKNLKRKDASLDNLNSFSKSTVALCLPLERHNIALNQATNPCLPTLLENPNQAVTAVAEELEVDHRLSARDVSTLADLTGGRRGALLDVLTRLHASPPSGKSISPLAYLNLCLTISPFAYLNLCLTIVRLLMTL